MADDPAHLSPSHLTEEELSERFLASLDRYPIFEDFDPSETLDDQAGIYIRDDLLGAALRPLMMQLVRRTYTELEVLLAQRGGMWDLETNRALFLALLLCGRHVCDGGVRVVEGDQLLHGDPHGGLDNLTIEPETHVGDFTVDFLLTHETWGPNPARRYSDDESTPKAKSVARRMALLREGSGPGFPDRQLRRTALTGLGIVVMPYEDADIERDPFAIAYRAVGDLSRIANDDHYS